MASNDNRGFVPLIIESNRLTFIPEQLQGSLTKSQLDSWTSGFGHRGRDGSQGRSSPAASSRPVTSPSSLIQLERLGHTMTTTWAQRTELDADGHDAGQYLDCWLPFTAAPVFTPRPLVSDAVLLLSVHLVKADFHF